MTKTVAQPDAKPPRSTAPASLLSQWWTLGTITADRRTTGRHAKVAWVIIDRYRQDFGNGRASVRYIARACDLSASIVSKACRELVEWGFFSQNIGIGTRPTEFTPNWATVPPVSNAKAGNISVLQGSNACVPQDSNASADSVLPVSHESYLLKPADRTGLQLVGNEFEAAPVAPLADGPVAAAAGPASGGFDEFWSIWPRKHGKAAARVAFGKVDEVLHDIIQAAARSWAAHYAKHSVEKKWIPEPANWLKGERWDEDLPIIHDDSKGAAIAKAKANAPARHVEADAPVDPEHPEELPLWLRHRPEAWPVGRHVVEVVNSEVDDSRSDETAVTFFYRVVDGALSGNEFGHRFWVKASYSGSTVEKGIAYMRSIIQAAGLTSTDDTDDLHGKKMLVIADGEGLTYAPLPANDNHALEATA